MDVRVATSYQVLNEIKVNQVKLKGKIFDYLWKRCDKPKTGQLEADILDSGIPLDDLDVLVFSDESVVIYNSKSSQMEAFESVQDLLKNVERVFGFKPDSPAALAMPGIIE